MRISDWSSDVCSSDLEVAVDVARSRDRLSVVKGARRRGQPPHLLGDAVHIDRQADAAVANQGETQFLFTHRRPDSRSPGAMARVSRPVAEVGESAAQRAFNLLHMRVVRISRATEQETRMNRRFAFAALACTALSAPALDRKSVV